MKERYKTKKSEKNIGKFIQWLSQEKILIAFLIITAFTMLCSIVWVYHIRVLNAPKIYSDGFGYFAYLPALVYRDFSFSFIETGKWDHTLKLIEASGGLVNKYPVGVAILESPFFFTAHLISLLRDAMTGSVTATGYSNLYQYMILVGGVCYWMFGTVLLYLLLTGYLSFSRKVSLLSCMIITYGTNLFHYASYDACFSHVYSYFLFNAFLYYLCWYEERDAEGRNRIWQTCIFGFLAGLIFMCRNTNILFVLTYVFYGVTNWITLKSRVVKILKPVRTVPIVLTGCVTIFPQLLYWHTATGHWFLYSYGSNETFYWLSPQLGNFLFSVRKGLFFWSPVLLLALFGMIIAYKKREKLYTGLVIFFIVIIYVSSTWWMWFYGGSFGQRVVVDFMCVFAVFIAVLLHRLEEWRQQCGGYGYKLVAGAVYGYCVICIVWNLICMAAYWYRVLPSDGANWNTIKDIVNMIL